MFKKNNKKGVIFTEKFALLNILKALEGISMQNSGNKQEENGSSDSAVPEQEKAVPQAVNTYPNVMASVLERHEAISNRVKNKK